MCQVLFVQSTGDLTMNKRAKSLGQKNPRTYILIGGWWPRWRKERHIKIICHVVIHGGLLSPKRRVDCSFKEIRKGVTKRTFA